VDADWVRLIEDRIEAAEESVKSARTDIDKIKAMMNWAIGAACSLGIVAGASGHKILAALLR
jgi:hypothetical protein